MNPFLAAAIPGFGQLISNQQNAMATFNANLQQQMFSERMYERTRRDNLEFWAMQNKYNSPEEQMKRFVDAGLSPYLMYGQGSAGQASSIPTPDVQPVNFRAPDFKNVAPDMMGALMSQADLRIKNAQADNLQAQNDVIKQDALLKALSIKRGQFDLGFLEETRPYDADARRELARQYRVNTDIAINRDAREAAMNASNLSEAVERMRNLKTQNLLMQAQRSHSFADARRIQAEIHRINKQVEIMKQDGTLKDIEIKLRDAGINPNDPAWQRWLQIVVDGLFSDGVEYLDKHPLPKSRDPYDRY